MALKLREIFAGGGASDSDRPALEQIEELTARNRQRPDAKVEAELVKLRNRAFSELDRTPPESSPESMSEVGGEAASAYDIVGGLPTIDASRLDPHVVRAAFLSHGSLIVRGLIDPTRANRLRVDMDRAFDGRDAFLAGTPAKKTTPWFLPFEPESEYAASGAEWNRIQPGSGSVWATDSPRVMFQLLEAFGQVGLPELIAGYLGERPVLSMKKSVLRRVSPTSGAAWHQDGAFLGEGLRTLNVWLALNQCGVDAPGLEVVPRRLSEIVPTGTAGALFDWSVSDVLVDELMDGAPIPCPVFEPGDAILFDHLCLHRTAANPKMKNLRYATETWCFAGSTYPDEQIPLVI